MTSGNVSIIDRSGTRLRLKTLKALFAFHNESIVSFSQFGVIKEDVATLDDVRVWGISKSN